MDNKKPFEGEADAYLLGLPKGVSVVRTPKLKAGDSRLVFDIAASDEALMGQYKELICEIVVKHGGQEIRQRSGKGILRVDPGAQRSGRNSSPARAKMKVLIAVLAAYAATCAPAATGPDPLVPSFRRDVMPIFFRAGCNQGACHGAARGKDGFMLSLFGYDAKGDYYRLTQEFVGRRINVAIPEQSLLLLKAQGKVPHTGGRLFTKDTVHYQTLLRWIEAGAPDDDHSVAAPVEITLLPDRMVFQGGNDHAADASHRPLLRRHEAGCHGSRPVRNQQSQRREDRQDGPRHRGDSRRYLCLRAIQSFHHRL